MLHPAYFRRPGRVFQSPLLLPLMPHIGSVTLYKKACAILGRT